MITVNYLILYADNYDIRPKCLKRDCTTQVRIEDNSNFLDFLHILTQIIILFILIQLRTTLNLIYIYVYIQLKIYDMKNLFELYRVPYALSDCIYTFQALPDNKSTFLHTKLSLRFKILIIFQKFGRRFR